MGRVTVEDAADESLFEEDPGTGDIERSRDPRLEDLFRSVPGIKFSFLPDLKLATVDVARGLKTQVRVGARLDPNTVEKYTLDAENGVRFPPIVVTPLKLAGQRGVTQYRPLDGLHRLTAFKEVQKTHHSAYEVVGEAEAIDLLATLINQTNGLPVEVEARRDQALHFLARGGQPAQAARLYSLSDSQVAGLVTKLQQRDRAREAGLSDTDWERIPHAIRTHLGRIRVAEVLAKAAAMYVRTAITGGEMKDLVRLLNAESSTAKQIALVDTYANEQLPVRGTEVMLAGLPQKGRRISGGAGRNIRTGLGQLRSAAQKSTDWVNDLDPSGAQALLDQIDGVLALLRPLRKVLTDRAAGDGE